MNVDNGMIYEGREHINEALARGENVVPVSREFAGVVKTSANPAEVARAYNNLKRTQPNKTEAELEELARKIAIFKQ